MTQCPGGESHPEAQGAAVEGEVPLQHGTANGYCIALSKHLSNQQRWHEPEWLTTQLSAVGEARAAVKWADGKVIKNEVDMQVCWKGHVSLFFHLFYSFKLKYLNLTSVVFFKGLTHVGTQNRGRPGEEIQGDHHQK